MKGRGLGTVLCWCNGHGVMAMPLTYHPLNDALSCVWIRVGVGLAPGSPAAWLEAVMLLAFGSEKGSGLC